MYFSVFFSCFPAADAFADCAADMVAGVFGFSVVAALHDLHHEGVEDGGGGGEAGGGHHIVGVILEHVRQADHHIGPASDGGIRKLGDGDDMCALLATEACEGVQLVGLAALGYEDKHIPCAEHADAAVDGIGWRDEFRGALDTAEGVGEFSGGEAGRAARRGDGQIGGGDEPDGVRPRLLIDHVGERRKRVAFMEHRTKKSGHNDPR